MILSEVAKIDLIKKGISESRIKGSDYAIQRYGRYSRQRE